MNTLAIQSRQNGERNGERGNVLFLILIAVALFAALSYAVTQSTRSSGGDASSETSLISSAQLTQYPASIRTSLVRMIISGKSIDLPITFNGPSDFGSITVEENVFHPDGGGATFTNAPEDLMVSTGSNPDGVWYFNANFEIPNIGRSDGDGNSNDVIAFLPGITKSLCDKINSELGIGATAPVWDATSASVEDSLEDGDTFPTTDQDDFDAALSGQPFGCFNDADLGYVYYHVLIER